MKSEVKEQKDMASVLSVIISLFAFILVLCSTMLVAYSRKISGNEKVVTTNKNMIVSYDNGSEIIIKNFKPGATQIYDFDISSLKDATTISEYELYLEIVDSDFNNEQIYYKITSSSSMGADAGKLVFVDTVSFAEAIDKHYIGTIKPGEKQNYNIKIAYINDATSKINNLKAIIHVEYKNK